ncbi:hypothetical protein Taro_021683, partial [Colocasia esculenta]|nr:hypothetical protein [Colocasia esculenta]
MFHRMYPNTSVPMPGQPSQQTNNQKQQDTEEIDPAPGTQYDILKHLDQTPAKISILELIKRSQTHQDALRAFLQRVMVSEDMNPDNLPSVLSIVNRGPTITFSDGELAALKARKMPLCVTLTINKVAVDAALVDTGASINVCPLSTLRACNISERQLQPTPTTIATVLPSVWPSNKPIISVLDVNYTWAYTFSSNRQIVSPPVVAIRKGVNANAKGWDIMFRLGYQSGKGLGAHLQGQTKTVATAKKFTKRGLGYSEWATFSSPPQSDHGPLTWSLYEHFVKGPIQPGYNTTTEVPRSAYQALEEQRPNKKKRAEEDPDQDDVISSVSLLFEKSEAEEEEPELEDLISAVNRLFSEEDVQQVAALSTSATTARAMFSILTGGVLRFWLAHACLGWPTALSRVCACLVLARLVVGYKPAVRRGFCCACPTCSPSAWHLRACPVQRLSPFPGTPILGAFEGAFEATSMLELAAELVDSGAEGKARFGQQRRVVCRALLVGLGCRGWLEFFSAQISQSFYSLPCPALVLEPCREAEAGARLAGRGHGWRVPLLVASGSGLVAVVVTVPVLGCQSVVALACVVSRPCGVSRVRGGSVCGPSTLWRFEVAMLVVFLALQLSSVVFLFSEFLLLWPVRD